MVISGGCETRSGVPAVAVETAVAVEIEVAIAVEGASGCVIEGVESREFRRPPAAITRY